VLLFTVYAGVIVDRVDKRRLMCGRKAYRCSRRWPWRRCVDRSRDDVAGDGAGAAVRIVNAFDIPARQAFIAELVGKEDLMNAIRAQLVDVQRGADRGPGGRRSVIGVAGSVCASS